MKEKKEVRFWNIPVPVPLDEALEKLIKEDMHISKAEAIREAVRRLLEERNYLPKKK